MSAVTIIQLSPEQLREIIREEVERVTREPAPQPEARWLTVPEAARRASRSPDTIREWIRVGRLRASREGRHGHWSIAVADLDAAVRGSSPAPVDGAALGDLILARRRAG